MSQIRLPSVVTELPLCGGESVPHILADVLRTEPDCSRLPKRLHPRVKALIERSLVKNPRHPLHAVADVRIEIEGVLRDPAGVTPASATGGAPSASPLWKKALPWAAAPLFLAVGWFLQPTPPLDQAVSQFEYLIRNRSRDPRPHG